MMKRYLFFIMITAVLSFSANRLSAQNSLVLHLPDTVITLNSVDSVYYSHDANGVLMQHVVTIDSLYTFAVDDVDSMFYLSPVVTLNGVVRGGIPDSMLVMTLVDIKPVSDTAFEIDALRNDHRQLVVVTNLDTLPLMLYRGQLIPGETIVIDTMSTLMALLSWMMPFDSLVNNDYEQFCAIVEQCVTFPTLYNLVSQSIAANRSLGDTLNAPMYEALGMVIAQIKQQITPPAPVEFSYVQGNNVMQVETSGSKVNMRMRYLNPTYIGVVRDEDGNIIRNFLRVPTRENYGITNVLLREISYYLAHNMNFWEDLNSGDFQTFELGEYAGKKIYFDFSCKNEVARIEFILQTFIIPILNFAGQSLDMDGLTCTEKTLVSFVYNHELSETSSLLTAGFSDLNESTQKNLVLRAFDENLGLIEEGLSAGTGYFECYYEKMSEKLYLKNQIRDQYKKRANFLKKIDKISTLIDFANIIARCNAYSNAPDNISFCMEWYNNVPEEAHYCTTPHLSCYSGNQQVGKADSLLASPLIFHIHAADDKATRHIRKFVLHLRVIEGNGTLEDTIMNVTTNQYYDVEKQTRWRLGPDTSLPQRAIAWLTDSQDSNKSYDTIELRASFKARVDSFRVKINSYATFSKGNLQYQPSSRTWRFAEHQYDVIGMDNLNITDGDTSYLGWIDLFSWSTRDNPTYVPTNNTYYNNGGGNVFYDWGDNPISNGDSVGGLWRTPEFTEWNYLLNSRPNATNLRTMATVVGVTGMILLPDNWQMPDSVDFIPDIHNFTENVYDTASWAIMEDAGAIFLPAAGFRYKQSSSLSSFSIYQLGVAGAYWSSWGRPYYAPGSTVEQRHAYRMAFFGSSGQIFPYQSVECYWGQSVRLIRTL